MKRLFVISGSSGVGKGTIIKEFLAKHPKFKLSISCTTRSKRTGEIDGEHYHFITREEFQKGIKNNDFIEWAEFSGNYYGTRKSNIEQTLMDGSNLILEIETRGAMQIKEQLPEAVLIFIAPPSFEELKKRLEGRHTEDAEVIEKRLSQAEREEQASQKYDYIIVNDTIKNALNNLEKIVSKYATLD